MGSRSQAPPENALPAWLRHAIRLRDSQHGQSRGRASQAVWSQAEPGTEVEITFYEWHSIMATAGTSIRDEVIEQFRKFVVPNYTRFPVVLVRGEGSHVWDSDGNRYLDFFPGWGCNLLGHCPEPVVRAVQQQVATLIHVPNTWYTGPRGNGHRHSRSGASAGRRFSATRGLRRMKRPS